ncbi:(2Fe-2S)-binding protein [Plantactinospora sp. KLBMP9567]|uniref:(2Fe-2S)-binding protein n=1 Tax=Plantactinospora sp. KLBMP9567 TaxID=3085900 RepID=UPI002981FEA7|nr:(2Fe-2S)-binding protein [Plantactinospora sp. KLBMP9567]MDW5324903.1 (2Fe-2S)-binding protein [Plantactinospora sp. KLBMP9567]
MEQTFELTVNGERRQVDADADSTLLHVLREVLGLKGSRFGCGLGLCGACFVLLDGRPAPSCDIPLWAATGRTVTTVEGLANGDVPHPVQRAFLDEQAAQCGYCVSGILVSAAALLAEHPQPHESTVAAALDRHLCRCGAQRRMVRAVVRAGWYGAGSTGEGGTGAGDTDPSTSDPSTSDTSASDTSTTDASTSGARSGASGSGANAGASGTAVDR